MQQTNTDVSLRNPLDSFIGRLPANLKFLYDSTRSGATDPFAVQVRSSSTTKFFNGAPRQPIKIVTPNAQQIIPQPSTLSYKSTHNLERLLDPKFSSQQLHMETPRNYESQNCLSRYMLLNVNSILEQLQVEDELKTSEQNSRASSRLTDCQLQLPEYQNLRKLSITKSILPQSYIAPKPD